MTESLLQQARELSRLHKAWSQNEGEQTTRDFCAQTAEFLDAVIEFLEWAKSEPPQFETPCLGQCPNYFRTKNATFWCTEVVDHEGPCHLPAIKGHRPTLTPTGQLERTHTLAIMAAVLLGTGHPDVTSSLAIDVAGNILAEVEKRNP